MKISDLIIVVLFVCYLLGFTCLPSKAQTIPTSSIIDVKEDDRVATYNQNCYQALQEFPIDVSAKKVPYNHPKVLASLVNSDDAMGYIALSIPKTPHI